MNKHDEWWHSSATNADICDETLTVDDFMPLITEDLLPVIQQGSSILDFGCGIGRLTIPMAQHFYQAKITGVDVSTKFLKQAILWSRKAGVYDHCHFTRTLEPSIKIDAAFSVSVFQHMPNSTKQEYIQQIANALNPGGIFRFQYVEGEADSFLTHDAHFYDVGDWCAQANLEVAHVDHDLIKPRWTWVTAVKEMR